jgi:predicted aspartyl protease
VRVLGAAGALALTLCGVARADSAGSEVPQAAVVGALPFLDYKEGNRIFLDVAPEGARPFRLVLDTGAESSVVTPLYARQLGVTVRRARETENRQATSLGRELEFGIDTASSDSGSRTGHEYGLLGGNFLGQFVVELDFQRRRVRFIDPDQFAVPKSVDDPNEAVLPLRVSGNRPFVTIELEGKSVDVLIDTGAPPTLVLSGASARRAGFEKKPLAALDSRGVLGKIESYLVEADELKLGPFAFAPAPLEFAPHGAYNQGGATDSFVGYDLLTHFCVRLDYVHKRVWLRREDQEPLAWLGGSWASVRRVGAFARVGDGGIEVAAVLPDSPAAKLGLRPGDEIEFHGDEPRAKALENALGAIERGESLTVVRERGENEPPEQVQLGAK